MRVHLFTDGAMARDSRNASAGDVVRDSIDYWVLRFNCYLGRCTLFEAELWGILDRLLILLNKSYKRATIQTDNLKVVRALTVNESKDSSTLKDSGRSDIYSENAT
ncbi:hypothetical protein Gotur_034043 [Gossypium turneri]